MARTYVVDLGSWSSKLVIATAGLRGITIDRVISLPLVGASPEAMRARGLAEIRDAVFANKLDHDPGYWRMQREVFVNLLSFPHGVKLQRRDMPRAVGTELEGLMPVDMEDLAIAFEPVAGGDSTRVLSFAMTRQKAQAAISDGKSLGIEPRGLLPSAGGAARLCHRLGLEGAVAVIDLGHLHTDVTIVSGHKPVFARVLMRGGSNVTEAIAAHWRQTPQAAEAAKHSDGFVASAMQPATSPSWAGVHQVIAPALAPLVRDLRQTLTAAKARVGVAVAEILLVGGAAQLGGLDGFLTEQLGVTCRRLTDAETQILCGTASHAEVEAAAVAIGMALEAGSGRPVFDLRQGALAAKVDLSFLRTKLVPLGSGAVAVMACAMIAGYANYSRLAKAEASLSTRLERETKEYFKQPISAAMVLKSGGASVVAAEASPLPKYSAYDLLLEINSRLPGKDKVTLDVSRLEIGTEKIELVGTAKKPEEIDLIETELKKLDCFTAITRGSTTTRENGVMEFSLSISSKCM